ncbi:hypothetical protein MITS9509_01865 [Synechococcus sp. MIT S9509]|nr:hypothetical protein MITS9509_01865 [Synechococcus sp. MIT S9509]
MLHQAATAMSAGRLTPLRPLSGYSFARRLTQGRHNLLQRVHSRFFPMDNAKFGFSAFAEQWNGRLAMMGFVIGLGTELLTGQGILSQVGLG